jgi:hypothetical protein
MRPEASVSDSFQYYLSSIEVLINYYTKEIKNMPGMEMWQPRERESYEDLKSNFFFFFCTFLQLVRVFFKGEHSTSVHFRAIFTREKASWSQGTP